MFDDPDIANEKLRFLDFFELSIGTIVSHAISLALWRH